jgi:hypothetical protein
MRKPVRAERIYVYCPRGLKGELLKILDREGGSLSAWILSLVRSALRDAKKNAPGFDLPRRTDGGRPPTGG